MSDELEDKATKTPKGENMVDEIQNKHLKPEIMDFNPEIENAFIEKAKIGIDKFVSEGGQTILFDWDGTIRGNNFEQGVSNYIRRGFVETYKYAREKGLKVGVCSLRSVSEIEGLSHLGITFDECNGTDNMREFIESTPSNFHEDALEIHKLSREELEKTGTETIKKIQEGEKPKGWEILLQAIGEFQASNKDYPNIKILFVAHRLSSGDKVFLIDDDDMYGGTAEKFGVGIKVPRPTGYKHDNKS